jgi:hypothetical protein
MNRDGGSQESLDADSGGTPSEYTSYTPQNQNTYGAHPNAYGPESPTYDAYAQSNAGYGDPAYSQPQEATAAYGTYPDYTQGQEGGQAYGGGDPSLYGQSYVQGPESVGGAGIDYSSSPVSPPWPGSPDDGQPLTQAMETSIGYPAGSVGTSDGTGWTSGSSGYGEYSEYAAPNRDDRRGANASGTDSDDPEVIRAEIEQTRSELSGTINAIQEKLSPQNLVEQAKESVRDATIGRVEQMVSDAKDTARDTGDNLMQMVRDNPLPAAIVGLGLGWLFMKNRDKSQDWEPRHDTRYRSGTYEGNYGGNYNRDYDYRSSGRSYSGQSEGFVEGTIDKVRQNPLPAALAGAGLLMLMNKGGDSKSEIDRPYYARYGGYEDEKGGIGSTVQQAGEKIGDTAGDVADKVGDVAGRAGDAIGSAAGQVKETVGDVAGGVAHTAGNVAGGTGDVLGKVLRTIGQNPIPAALAGASIGWLWMQSNSEGRQRMSQVGHKVGDVAGGAGEAVGDAAGNVVVGVRHGAEAAQTNFQRLLLGNPLAAGALAVGVGAALGLAVPETEQEHQILGQTKDKLVDKAQMVANSALDKVEEASQNVLQRVEETATDATYRVEQQVTEM